MVFNSFSFLVFITVVVLLYYMLPHRFRWVLILTASFVFYMVWNPVLITLLLFTVFINYIISLRIFFYKNKKGKILQKRLLILCIIINFGILFIFKYLPLLNQTIAYIYKIIGLVYIPPDFSIILPMGISFYTFQAVGYTIDIYKKKYEPERNFFKFCLFITFFPQLVAGPIERAKDLMPQLFSKKTFKLNNIILGLKFIIFGLFKKVVIADRIAVAVNTVYSSPKNYEGLYFIIATFLFSFQIYCDFCGYSDIAVGCAKLLDINLMQNFKQPYFSKSIKEFWRRWHISLSTWFKDYVYFPLGGNRVSKPRHYFNLIVTFLVSGIWHGANWTFIIWGGLHGLYQIIESILDNIKRKVLIFLHIDNFKFDFFLINIIKVIFTFLIVSFTYIFFRGNKLEDSYYIVTNLFRGYRSWTTIQYVYDVMNNMGITLLELLISFACILFLMLVEFFCREDTIHNILMKTNGIFRFLFYFFVSILILSLGVYYNAGEFIYFQF